MKNHYKEHINKIAATFNNRISDYNDFNNYINKIKKIENNAGNKAQFLMYDNNGYAGKMITADDMKGLYHDKVFDAGIFNPKSFFSHEEKMGLANQFKSVHKTDLDNLNKVNNMGYDNGNLIGDLDVFDKDKAVVISPKNKITLLHETGHALDKVQNNRFVSSIKDKARKSYEKELNNSSNSLSSAIKSHIASKANGALTLMGERGANKLVANVLAEELGSKKNAKKVIKNSMLNDAYLSHKTSSKAKALVPLMMYTNAKNHKIIDKALTQKYNSLVDKNNSHISNLKLKNKDKIEY